MSEYVRQKVNFSLSVECLDLLAETTAALGLSKSAAVEVAVRRLWQQDVSALAGQLSKRRRR